MIVVDEAKCSKSRIRTHFLKGVSIVALTTGMQIAFAASVPANAQGSGAIEEVVVTGTRLTTAGITAPTPVTSLSADELLNSNESSLVHALEVMPSLSASSNTSTGQQGLAGGNGSESILNLRNLGAQRTLVLLDGNRVAPDTTALTVDIAMIPQSLVKRVDVVTGGASAAYGSDAVAGVVNFILDTNFTGLKANINVGANEGLRDDGEEASITYGTTFFGDRLHVVANAEYKRSAGLTFGQSQWGRRNCSLVSNANVTAANPASPTNPINFNACGVENSTILPGGLITSGPLQGTDFEGGTPEPFQYGTNVTSTLMIGGGGVTDSPNRTLIAPDAQQDFFAHADYNATDDLSFFVEGSYNLDQLNVIDHPDWQIGSNNFTIFSGNPYIPASTQAAMTAQKITSFSLGDLDTNWGGPELYFTNITKSRIVVGGKDKLSDDWSVDAHYEYGSSLWREITTNNFLDPNLYNAVNAVVSPTTGQIVCANAAAVGCIPVNPFGPGSPTPAALNYLNGGPVGSDWARRLNVENDVAANVEGTPFSDWAGEISTAFGVEYRSEYVNETASPSNYTQMGIASAAFSTGAPIATVSNIAGFPSGYVGKIGEGNAANQAPDAGKFNVTEGYFEVNVPLVKDQDWTKAFDVNAAARYAAYSDVGDNATWKVGVVWQPIEDLRFRAVESRDVRAPNQADLYATVSTTALSGNDPKLNGAPLNGWSEALGNPNLKAEKAYTRTAGVTYQPSWIPGLSGSVDYWNLSIGNAITSLGPQVIINECSAGVTSLCSLIVRDPTTNVVNLVFNRTLNGQTLKTSGLDFELNYATAVSDLVSGWDGDLSLRAVAENLMNDTSTVLGTAPVNATGGPNLPMWQGSLTAMYNLAPWSFFVQERIVGEAQYSTSFNNSENPGVDPANETAPGANDLPLRAYTNMTVHYLMGEGVHYDLYFTVNNVFDQQPPFTGGYLAPGLSVVGSNVYDMVGRAFLVGLKFTD